MSCLKQSVSSRGRWWEWAPIYLRGNHARGRRAPGLCLYRTSFLQSCRAPYPHGLSVDKIKCVDFKILRRDKRRLLVASVVAWSSTGPVLA